MTFPPVLGTRGAGPLVLTRFAAASLRPAAPLSSLPEHVWLAFHYYDRLAKLLRHLDQHIHDPLSLAQAATIACMEKTAFCRFFRRATGMSYTSFQHALRVSRGAQLLISSDIAIAEVAAAVGYVNNSLFGKHFKKLTKMTPRQYRASVIMGDLA